MPLSLASVSVSVKQTRKAVPNSRRRLNTVARWECGRGRDARPALGRSAVNRGRCKRLSGGV